MNITKPQIGELSRGKMAKKSGVNAETIRYYEDIGLLPEPSRSENNYRIYNQSHLKRLFFIRRTRELGFTLKEVEKLLELVDGGSYTCAEVQKRTESHLADVHQKIADLEKMRETLKGMVSKCNGGLIPDCPIIEQLNSN